MVKILITGSSGMIAYHLIKQLNKNDKYELHCVDKLSNNISDDNYSFERINSLKSMNKKIFFYQDELFTNDIIKNINPDIIIHLAADSGVSASFKNPNHVLKNNNNSFLTIIDGIRSINPNIKLIYASSSSVYGNTTEMQNENNNLLKPTSSYGLSKLMNEQIAQLYFNNYNITSVGLRFFTVYGDFNRKDMLMHYLLDSFTLNKNVNLYNNGNMKRDFTYVGDVANTIKKFIDNINLFKEHHIFNVGGSGSVSLLEVVNLLQKEFSNKPNITLDEFCPPYDPLNTFCDNRKLLSYFNDLHFTNIEDGIKKLCLWFKNK